MSESVSAQGGTRPTKRDIVAQIVESISSELETIERSARSAHEAATHEESRSEDAHDTRSIEAGYLAGAQTARALELKKTLIEYRELALREFGLDEAVAVGALVLAALDEKKGWYFIVGSGAAGSTVQVNGVKVQIVTARSPLGEALIGFKRGDSSELESQRGTVEIEILEVS